MRRVVVTGIGLLTPIGSGKDEFWSALIAGKCGIAPVTSFDTSTFPVHKGAAMLVLESLGAARARGAKICAEVLGYGVSCDSHHMVAAHPQGDGAMRAMAAAMRESGVSLQDIDYISAHGTGTPANDRMESIAVRRLFGKYADRIPMSSIKSMLGHTMGPQDAAGLPT